MKTRKEGGFTLTELVAILAVVALLAVTLAPASARTKSKSKTVYCLNNLHRFTSGWLMYVADNNDRVANNFTIPNVENAVTSKRFDNWANNLMYWSADTSLASVSVTNLVWATSGPFGEYVTADAFKCPADVYLSPAQIQAGFKQRVRSISMSFLFGRLNSSVSIDPPVNVWYPQYRQYLKKVAVPKPEKTWLVLNEHPDSINDGYFMILPGASQWGDLPASYHEGGCGFGFVDGHSEIRKWLSRTSLYPVRYFFSTRPFDALGRADFAWFVEHSGYVDAQTGKPLFNY